MCSLLRPIGDDAGPGQVESGKCRILPGSPLHFSGRGGEGEGHGFSYLPESDMTYLAGSHILRSWPVIQLTYQAINNGLLVELIAKSSFRIFSFRTVSWIKDCSPSI